MEDLLTYLIGLASGLAVASFSYWLALRFPAKERLHECYGNLLPLVNETMLLQGQLKSLRQIDVKTADDFWATYVSICEHLMSIHDTATMIEIAGLITVDPSALTRRDQSELLIFQRLIAQRAISAEIIKNARAMYRHSISLELLSPSEDVMKHLNDIKSLLLTQTFEMSKGATEDISNVVDVGGIRARIEARESAIQGRLFGADLESMLVSLRDAMKCDLARKF